MAKKSSDNKARLQSAIITVPESIISYMTADAENRDKLLAIRVKPKEKTWDGIRTHSQMRLSLQQLQSDYVQLLYSLWDTLWLDATADSDMQSELERDDLWKDGSLWRNHKLPIEFSTGIILDMGAETPELQIGLYVEKAESLKELVETGWTFDEGWESFITPLGLMPLSPSAEAVSIEALQELASSAIVLLKTLLPA